MEIFDTLYLQDDSSVLNQTVGELLVILDAHEEGTSYEGNYEETVSTAESSLGDAIALVPERQEGISALIKKVKDLGKPHDPDDDTDSVRPKKNS